MLIVILCEKVLLVIVILLFLVSLLLILILMLVFVLAVSVILLSEEGEEGVQVVEDNLSKFLLISS